MAQNDINITFRLNEDGSIKQVTANTKKLAKETQNLSNSQGSLNKKRNDYQRQEKGAAQITSNSTKAFAKQAQTVGGGLVPAYATLAANIFAVTAAFGVLQRAAQVEQLTQGLAEMGRASGYAMMTLSRGMQEATGHALSLEEAMRATSMITSAGFDSSTVTQIGEAAQKASVALGRNTQESLERFTRGLVKMEPELLDELGLFVRVDEAAEEYARTLGKSANDLTNFEKRQAFANSALEQAREKFGAVEVDTNPYDKLASSFADLTKSILGGLNTAIIPLVEFLSSSTGALIGVLTLFISTISSELVGSLQNYADKAKKAAIEQRGLTTSARKSLDGLNRSAESLTALSESLKDGAASNREYKKAIDGQVLSQRVNLSLRKKGVITEQEYTARVQAANQAIKEINATQIRQRLATAANAEAKTIAAIATGRYDVALKNLNRTFKFYGASLKTAAAAQGFFNKTLKISIVLSKAAGTAFRLLGAAISTLLGPISLVITGLSLLYEGFQWLRDKMMTEEAKKLRDVLTELEEPLKEITGNLSEVDSGLDGTSRKITSTTQAVIAYSNSLNSLLDALYKLEATGSPEAFQEQRTILQNIINSSDRLGDAYEATFGSKIVPTTKAGVAAAMDFVQSQERLATRIKGVQSAFEGAGISLQNYLNKFKQTSPVTDLKDKLSEVVKSLKGAQVGEISTIIAEQIAKTPGLDKLLASVGASEAVDALKDVDKVSAKLEKLKADQLSFAKTLKGQVTKAQANVLAYYMTAIQEAEKEAGIVKQTAEEKSAGSVSALQIVIDTLAAEERRAIVGKLQLDTLKEQLNLERAKGDKSESSLTKQITLQNQIKTEQINQNTARVAALQLVQKQLTDEAQILYIDKEIEKINKENLRLQEEKILGLEATLELQKLQLSNLQFEQGFSKALLDLDKRRASFTQTNIDLQQKALEFQKKAENRKDVFRKYDPSLQARDELAIQEQLLSQRIQQATAEYNIKKASLDMEYALLEQRLLVASTEAALAAEKSTDPSQKARLSQLSNDLKGQIDSFAGLKSSAENQLQQAFQMNILGLVGSYLEKQDETVKAALEGTQSGSMQDRIGAFAGLSSEQRDSLPMSQTLEAYEGMLAPMTETLSQLGPDGALAQAVVQGAFAVSGAWTNVGEVFAATGDSMAKGAAVAQAVGASIQAVGQIMGEQSNRQISAIDEQIAAEKKRDGSSSKSLAKIKALEQQKEKLERKRFEQQKKVQMATIIANTASAMMTALAAPPVGLGPVAGIPLAGVAAAMGALQLSVVAGTSYDGGSSSSPTAPGKVTVGERGTATDLASSRGGAGELSYFRGDRGIGGPENFTPAFTGMKYRASGGETTGFMVGEQGPEMFVPEKPGRIVPADQVSQGTPVNANINISAIDAAGVEDVLVRQRGHIIGMIREAANANGETFLESVSTMEL